MKVIWLGNALEGLKIIYAYIAAENPMAAYRTLQRIRQSAEDMLSAYPHVGGPGQIRGTRELVIKGTSYVMSYRVKKDCVEVLNVFHGAQNRPKSL